MGRPIDKKYIGPLTQTNTVLSINAWVIGDTQSRLGYIIKQTGSHRYKVSTTNGTNTFVGDVYLQNGPITGPGQATISFQPYGAASPSYALKVTDNAVTGFDGTAYAWYPSNMILPGAHTASIQTNVDSQVFGIIPTSLTGLMNTFPFSQTLTTVNGSGNVTLAQTAGSLPSGLTFNANTGVISGTPTSATAYNFTITATDSKADIAVQPYTGSIAPAFAFTTTSLSGLMATFPFNTTLATVNGVAPLTYSVSSGNLPSGLNLNSLSGVLSGTPSNSGAYNFTVHAVDSQSHGLYQPYSGTISAAFAITTGSLNAMTAGVAFNQTVSTANGVSPVTFNVASGVLPTGLNLNTSTGAISGTLSAPGAYSFTIGATDNASHSVTQPYSGTIAQNFSITTPSLNSMVVNVPFSQTIQTSGGSGTGINFSVSAGTLPTGLVLTTSNGTISGTPTTIQAYSFTIEAIDSASNTAFQPYTGSVTASANDNALDFSNVNNVALGTWMGVI